MPNKYVEFVSDECFKECVKMVCDTYEEIKNEKDQKKFFSRGIDVIKMIFDIGNVHREVSKWVEGEKTRQADKTISNVIGDFHQKLLGSVKDWEDLRKGHATGVDIRKKDDTIYMELKNKHNTTKGENKPDLFDKLERVAKQFTSARVYYAYIIPANGTSGERRWTISGKSHERIWEAWGSRVYEIVTGDANALKNTWKALPVAINDVLSSNLTFNEDDKKKISNIFEYTLNRTKK